ncbi:MAG: hypothetical protein IKW58_00455 [Alphaproteobacteria bacterium]|nr:hypothetical protein [Alphaproteobacteria bacterium]
MAATFEQKFKVFKKWSTIILLSLGGILLILSFFFGEPTEGETSSEGPSVEVTEGETSSEGPSVEVTEGETSSEDQFGEPTGGETSSEGPLLLSLWGLSLIATVGIIHCMWFVPTGYVGYATFLGKLINKTYEHGLNWVIPFLTDTFLMDTTMVTKKIVDTKKVKTRNDITLEYTLTYQLDPRFVHLVFKEMKADYWNTHLSTWVDAVFDTFVSQLSYQEFQLRKDEVEKMSSAVIAEEIDKKCVAMSNGLTHNRSTKRYTIERRVENVPAAEDPSKLIALEMIYLNEYDELVDGVNFFKYVNLKINDVKFEEDYEKAIAKVAVARAKTVEAEELSKQMEIQANARKKATIIEAEGQAEALKLKGASENEIKEALGEILKKNPELIKDKLAEHFPQVLGGNVNPMITIESTAGHS